MDVINLKRERLEIAPRETNLRCFVGRKVIVGADGHWKSVDSSHLAPVSYIASSVNPDKLADWQTITPQLSSLVAARH
jgi:hypothetical protein